MASPVPPDRRACWRRRIQHIAPLLPGARPGSAAAPAPAGSGGGLVQPCVQPPPAPACSVENAVSQAAELSLLSDGEMRRFIAAGFLALAVPELPPSFHAAIHSRAERVFGRGGQGGEALTNVAVKITPELQQLLETPTVAGALVSLLGPGFTFGHLGAGGCALHCSLPDGDQILHTDSQRAGRNGHRTRAVMVLYYPAGAGEDMGPTALVPSSHLLAPDGLGLSMGVMKRPDGPEAEADRADWSGVQLATAHPANLLAPSSFSSETLTKVKGGAYELIGVSRLGATAGGAGTGRAAAGAAAALSSWDRRADA